MKNFKLHALFGSLMIFLFMTFTAGDGGDIFEDEVTKPLNIELMVKLAEDLNITKFDLLEDSTDINNLIQSQEKHGLITLNQSLEKTQIFQKCRRTIIEADIMALLANRTIVRCSQVLNPIKAELNFFFNDIFNALESVKAHKLECETTPRICGIGPTYKVGVALVNYTRGNSSLWNNWTAHRETIKTCNADLLLQVTSAISSLVPDHNCSWVNRYKNFLQKHTLWPMEFNKLVDPNRSEFMEILLKNISKTRILHVESDQVPEYLSTAVFSGTYKNFLTDKRSLKYLLSNQSSSLSNYVEDYLWRLENQTSTIIKAYVSQIGQLIYITLGKEFASMNPECHVSMSQYLVESVETYYKTQLPKQCFSAIYQTIITFHEIQNRLELIERQLHELNDISPIVSYEALVPNIINIGWFYEDWEDVNLLRLWSFARSCYNAANSVILQNVRKQVHIRLMDCSSIVVTNGIISQLPIDLTKYPNSKLSL